MPFISPECLESLVELGKWLGVTEVNMARAIQEPALGPELERIGGISYHMEAGSNIADLESARDKIMQNCPQGEEADEIGILFESAQKRFQASLDSVKEQWAAGGQDHGRQIVAQLQLRDLQVTLLDWLDNIVFHSEPSRHKVAR